MTLSPAAEKPNYLALNAMLNLFDENGHIQFDKDQEAARQYFLQDVNKRLRYFKEGLEEKIAYLWKNDYYEREFIEQYDWEFVKRLYKRIYGAKFRFATFVGAYKFYTGYALRSFDGEEYLETYEDRIAAVAMLLGAGNERQATQLADEMINQRYQPATPTFLNAGKKQRGELVSCFPAGSLVSTAGGKRVPIEQVREGDEVATHAGRTRKVVRTMKRTDSNGLLTIKIAGQAKPLTCTPEHPILVHRPKKWETMNPVLRGDGDSDHVWWIRAGDIRPGDFVVAGFESYEPSEKAQIDVGGHLQSDVVEIDGRLHVPLKDARWSAKHGRTVSTQTKSLPTHVETSYGFGRFVGYYLAEGHVGDRSVFFTFGSTEDEWMSDVEALSSEIFGLVPERNVRADGSTTVNINSKLLAELFRSLVGTGFDRKLLPVELLQGSDEFLRGVLVGAFRGDGCTHGQAMVMDMVNLPLIHQLRGVALSVGVPTFERVYANRAGNPTGGLHIPSNSQAGHDFILEVAKNLHRFASSMDKGARSSYARRIDGRHMFRVSSVEHTPGSNVVYNIEVEDDHTYVVEGIVVHNCFLVEIQDDMHSIGRAVNSALQLSKRGGGVAFNLTNIRAAMDPIKGIKNASSGILPIMKLLEDSFSYANQLGARQGAGAVYLNAHHLDVEAFLDCKKEAADEKVRIKTLSLGIVIPDITLELATKNEEMYLFSPYDVSRKYGKPYSQVNLTKVYRELVDDPKIRKSAFPGGARGFFQHLAEVQFESGYPYVMFEDNVNRQSEIRGKVTMSNLCVTGETELLTADGVFTARELHERGGDLTVMVDDRTRGEFDETQRGVSAAAAIPMQLTARDAQIFKVRTREGFKLRATEWHKMFVLRRDGTEKHPMYRIEKVPLGRLLPGDEILVQSGEGAFGTHHDPKLARERGAGAMGDQAVPEFVERGDRETQLAYLRGLLQPDGNASGSQAIWSRSNELDGASRTLLVKVQRMLLNFGIYSRVYRAAELDGASSSLWVMDREACESFASLSAGLAVTSGTPRHRFTATVESIEPDGIEDVYDTTVEGVHSLIFNGIVTGNCSEILQVSEASEIDENQDYVVVGKDISCNLGSMNISRAMDGPSLRNTVETAIRSLTEVSDTSDVAVVPSIHAGNERSHAVGLGQMNLHGYLARSGIDYASKAAVDFTDAYFRTVRYHAIWASTRIARERERTFDGFEHSKYATGAAFEKYLRPYQPKTAKVRRLFEEAGHQWPTEDDWRRLAAHVRRHGMYHQNLLAVAPTGSISYVNHATSSIHPITAKIEMRSEGGMGRVYYPAAHMDDDNQHLYRDAYDIGYEALIDIYAAATPHVDQGLSLTLFLTSDMTTRDLNRAQIYAWKKGLKTIYYVRVRSEAIAGTDQEGCVSCAV